MSQPKTLYILLADFQQWRRSLSMNSKTLQKNQYGLQYYIKWLVNTYHVETADRIRKTHLYAWQEHVAGMTNQKGMPLKPCSINNHIESVKMFLSYLVSLGYINKSYMKVLQYVKVPQHLPGNVIEHAQMKKVLACVPTGNTLGYRNRAMMEMLYSTGIRISELLGLNVEDLDMKNTLASVTGKGDKQRLVPIGRTALRHLETYVVAVRPYLLKDRSEKAVFLSKHGKRLGYRGFLAFVHKCGELAGVEGVLTPHTFRRSCTTELIRGNANMYHVKELLGHESLDTLKHYAKLTITDLKATHKKCHPREQDQA